MAIRKGFEMKALKELERLLPVLYPKFYTITDDLNNELVFLDIGASKISKKENICIKDRTQCEAVENHFHLFDKLSVQDISLIKEVGTIIAQNMLNSLKQSFPDKSFIVYLEINIKDSTIIRFHQIWKDEALYFDTSLVYDASIYSFIG